MRVLLLAQWYPPIIGGEEGHVRRLGQELAARGHKVGIATLQQQGPAGRHADGEVDVYHLPGVLQRLPFLYSTEDRRSAPPAPDPATVLALASVIRRERPQIIHAHNWLIHAALPIASLSGARLLLTLHDYSLVCAKKSLIYRGAACSGPALSKCIRCAAGHYGAAKGTVTVLANMTMERVERIAVDRFLAVSRSVFNANRLERHGSAAEVIPNFITDDRGAPKRDVASWTDHLPSDDFILFVGSLARAKGVDVLLDAYDRLINPPRLVLIGYPTAEVIPGLAQARAGVHVFERWPSEAVTAAWHRSAIGVVPSTWQEPCPTVAMEAMLAGKPVVASNVGGLTDIVADSSGILVPPGDPAALAAALQRLLDDRSLREDLGSGGRRRVSTFLASTVVPKIERAYRQVLSAASISA